MPKVYLTKQDEMSERLVMMIYGAMKVQNVTQTDMADELMISQPAFRQKLKTKHFSFTDLITIFAKLGIQDDQILSVMKMK